MRHEWILASCHVSARSTQKFSRIKELHDMLPPRQQADGSIKELVPDQHIEEFMPDGKDVFTDVSVIHPVAESYIQKATSELGAAKYREGTKDAEYAEACRAAGKAFIPVVFETYGAWGPGAQQLFKIMKVNMGPGTSCLRGQHTAGPETLEGHTIPRAPRDPTAEGQRKRHHATGLAGLPSERKSGRTLPRLVPRLGS